MQTRTLVFACVLALPVVTDGATAFGQPVSHVPHANPKAAGVTSPNALSPELAEIAVAQGTTPLPPIDGSTWYPWSERLLLTQEGNGSTSGGLWQATPDYPSSVQSLASVVGRGGFEGVQADSDGNIWIVEDIGGATVAGAK